MLADSSGEVGKYLQIFSNQINIFDTKTPTLALGAHFGVHLGPLLAMVLKNRFGLVIILYLDVLL